MPVYGHNLYLVRHQFPGNSLCRDALLINTNFRIIHNFKIVDDTKIRIYEQGVTTQRVSRELMANEVEIMSINRHTESLEEYFLKMTAEVGRSC